MNLLLYGEIRPGAVVPDFGPDLAEHLRRKANPQVLASSRAAWGLLGAGLRRLGVETMPVVRFSANGKPRFEDSILHFSLSHSGNLAAALLSEAPCGVDVEQLRPEVAARLARRCLSERERDQGCDFFVAWTRKECIAKLDGSGMSAHPDNIDTLDARHAGRFRSLNLSDAQGQRYALSLLCDDPEVLEILEVK